MNEPSPLIPLYDLAAKKPRKPRSKNARRQVCVFAHANGPVKLWLDLETKMLCFRVKHSRQVFKAKPADVWDQLTGQGKMTPLDFGTGEALLPL